MAKDIFKPSVYGIGYLGVAPDEYPGGNLGNSREYETWKGMLRRCYNNATQEKHPSYKDCYVHSDWHNFNTFALWYKNQIGYDAGWHLDKDLTFTGNKVYSAQTCALVPRDINNLFVDRHAFRGVTPIGVYYDRVKCKYIARVGEGGSNYIGTYSTAHEAFNAYKGRKEAYVKVLAERYRKDLSTVIYENLMNFAVDITD